MSKLNNNQPHLKPSTNISNSNAAIAKKITSKESMSLLSITNLPIRDTLNLSAEYEAITKMSNMANAKGVSQADGQKYFTAQYTNDPQEAYDRLWAEFEKTPIQILNDPKIVKEFVTKDHIKLFNLIEETHKRTNSLMKDLDFGSRYNSPKTLYRVPYFIGILTETEMINLSSNKLQSLPRSLENCHKLYDLNVMNNELRTLPDSLKNLSNIKHIRLSRNYFKEIPDVVFDLKSLTAIEMEGDSKKVLLTHIPDKITQLTELSFIRMQFHNIEALPVNIGMLTKLKKLKLYGNSISEIPDSMSKLTNLKHLNIASNCINPIPNFIRNMSIPNLEIFGQKK